ncbi:MAG: hypothetical protein ORN51_14105 [Akkermansiaceae bacterium]|nr:hypothetical protein [Akkermansiaceae bacterium]
MRGIFHPSASSRFADRFPKVSIVFVAVVAAVTLHAQEAALLQFSGIYPSLAMFNQEGECGTGALVPWADRLWVVTYGPHCPNGSSDRLYEITPDLQQINRPESVGGTAADRMIHRESGQLLIGPYLIDRERKVRVLTPYKMPGRLTGVARHLTDPANKVYYATMEEGLYEVDVNTLNVSCIIRDGQFSKFMKRGGQFPDALDSELSGYHGKGLYSGQGRLVYSNNGERSKEAEARPDIASGALAEWSCHGSWQLIRRNQFTDVTGPGGIFGNSNPATDPLWSVGWDHRSLILMLLENGEWHSYRLPKASHCYDGAHGWNTEWPRIRDIGEPDLLMTMHGMFWKFPRNFSTTHAGGIRPRSSYLKVIGDFCRWQERLVFGADDAAKSEFLNKRPAKGGIAGPGQSQSNLWFTDLTTPDHLGPASASGAVWMDDTVVDGQVSEPFLFAGFHQRALFIRHGAIDDVRFDLEIDVDGKDQWKSLRQIVVGGGKGSWVELGREMVGEWIRIRAGGKAPHVTALFQYTAADLRLAESSKIFVGLAKITDRVATGGLLRARGGGNQTLAIQTTRMDAEQSSRGPLYELDASMKLKPLNDPAGEREISEVATIPRGLLTSDAASAIFHDADGRAWRFPKSEAAYDRLADGATVRIAREVCTERDLFNCHGTFYELPAENAGGIAKVRPIATHHLKIQDYGSYRGMLVLTGIQPDAVNPHIIHSADREAAVWVGVADDLWALGKPRGSGGPWKHSSVRKGIPSDPYLMNGFDHKRLTLENEGPVDAIFHLEVDPSGDGAWTTFETYSLKAGESLHRELPSWFQAHWVRLSGSGDTVATAQLSYD